MNNTDSMPPYSLHFLSSELLYIIIACIDSQRDLNALSQSSKILYYHATPRLYRKWSYHGLREELKPLRQFLETLNWRPDLALHVKELDIREWGDCPRLEDHSGDEGIRTILHCESLKRKEEANKEKERGTLMDDGIFGDGDDSGDETYEESSEDAELEESSRDGEVDLSDDEDQIDRDELELLGPIRPVSHENCVKFRCTDNRYIGFERAGQDYEREDMILDYVQILEQQEEDKLIIMLLSKLPNLQTLYVVMPEASYEWYGGHAFHKFFENMSDFASKGILQKLESLYICSPMYLGVNGHREYDIDLRNLFPFMQLPKMRSLYALTAHIFWHISPRPSHRFADLNLSRTSNITTLCYDEAVAAPIDVLASLDMFKGLESFRWTTTGTTFVQSIGFIGISKSLGQALWAHKDSLAELYIDIRHHDAKGQGRRRSSADSILIGALKEYRNLRKLSIDVGSLCGHEDWMCSPLPLIDVLPPSLESLTLFAKVIGRRGSIGRSWFFADGLWLSSLESLIRHPPSVLRKLSINVIPDPEPFSREPETIMHYLSYVLEDTRLQCINSNIAYQHQIVPEIDLDEERHFGLTEIPYFLEQIRDRIPAEDD